MKLVPILPKDSDGMINRNKRVRDPLYRVKQWFDQEIERSVDWLCSQPFVSRAQQLIWGVVIATVLLIAGFTAGALATDVAVQIRPPITETLQWEAVASKPVKLKAVCDRVPWPPCDMSGLDGFNEPAPDLVWTEISGASA